MADAYCQAVLFPDVANIVGVPDCFPRRTATWRLTTQTTLTSSTANGHILMTIFPQGAVTTGNFFTTYADGGSALDVTNYQSATVTATNVVGTSVSTNYNYIRVVGCQFKFIYIGAEQTAAGEATVAILNQNIASGNNVAAMARDSDFRATGRAESEFVINWIPLDYADLEFRTANDNADADKGSYWGTMCMVGTGFPKATVVYAVEISVIVEGIVAPTSGDFIPRSISAILSPDMALCRLKQLIMSNPGYVARCKHLCINSGFSRAGTPGDGAQGGPARPSPIIPFKDDPYREVISNSNGPTQFYDMTQSERSAYSRAWGPNFIGGLGPGAKREAEDWMSSRSLPVNRP